MKIKYKQEKYDLRIHEQGVMKYVPIYKVKDKGKN